MQLYMFRHAFAGERGDPNYPDDALRPLTRKGKRRFRKLARQLVQQGVAPAVVASSPFVRCVETARILVEALDGHPELVLLDSLEPGSNLDELLHWTHRQGDVDVAWVGHAPDVEILTASLVGLSGGAGIRFAKGAAASIKFEAGLPARGAGKLQWLLTAKMLGL